MKAWTSCAYLTVLMIGGWSFAAEPPVSALQSMHRLVDALERGDLAGAKSLALDHAGFLSFSSRKRDPKEYEGNLDDFLRGVSRELASGVKLLKADCADVLILPAGVKTKREVVMAVIHASFQFGGKPAPGGPMTFLFVHHAGGWKFFLRK